MPRQLKEDKKLWKLATSESKNQENVEMMKSETVKRSSSKSDLKRRDSLKSTSSMTSGDIRRTSSSKSMPVRKESVAASPNEFLAKVRGVYFVAARGKRIRKLNYLYLHRFLYLFKIPNYKSFNFKLLELPQVTVYDCMRTLNSFFN